VMPPPISQSSTTRSKRFRTVSTSIRLKVILRQERWSSSL